VGGEPQRKHGRSGGGYGSRGLAAASAAPSAAGCRRRAAPSGDRRPAAPAAGGGCRGERAGGGSSGGAPVVRRAALPLEAPLRRVVRPHGAGLSAHDEDGMLQPFRGLGLAAGRLREGGSGACRLEQAEGSARGRARGPPIARRGANAAAAALRSLASVARAPAARQGRCGASPGGRCRPLPASRWPPAACRWPPCSAVVPSLRCATMRRVSAAGGRSGRPRRRRAAACFRGGECVQPRRRAAPVSNARRRPSGVETANKSPPGLKAHSIPAAGCCMVVGRPEQEGEGRRQTGRAARPGAASCTKLASARASEAGDANRE